MNLGWNLDYCSLGNLATKKCQPSTVNHSWAYRCFEVCMCAHVQWQLLHFQICKLQFSNIVSHSTYWYSVVPLHGCLVQRHLIGTLGLDEHYLHK